MEQAAKQGRKPEPLSSFHNIISLGLPLIVLASMISMPLGTIIQNNIEQWSLCRYIAPEKM